MERLTRVFGQALLLGVCGLVAGCGGGGRGGGGGAGDPPLYVGAPILVVAGTVPVAPSAGSLEGLDLARLGVDPVDVEAVYRLSTPSSTPFHFEVSTWGASDAGISIAHAAAAGVVPEFADTTRSLTEAGIHFDGLGRTEFEALGQTESGSWFDSSGDERAWIELRGEIQDSQAFLVRARSPSDTTLAVVFLEVGSSSEINPPFATGAVETPVENRLLASSTREAFGYPALGIGFESPVALWYDADSTSQSDQRYEWRVRAATPALAGALAEAGPHTLRADHDVDVGVPGLIIARASAGTLTLEFSAGDGTVFEEPAVFPGVEPARFPVIALAPGMGFAVAYWRGQNLMLVEGLFPFRGLDRERRIFSAPPEAQLLPASLAWTLEGDLVVGYAYEIVKVLEDLTPLAVNTSYRCWYLSEGDESPTDVLVDETTARSGRPAVCVARGTTMPRIFYAHGSPEGIRLRESNDGAAFFGQRLVGAAGAHRPFVFARQESSLRVDVLHQQPTARGRGLHRTRWIDYDAGSAVQTQVVRAWMTWRETGPASAPGSAVYSDGTLVPWFGYEGREVRRGDYDAVERGGAIHVLCGERRVDKLYFVPAPGRTWGSRSGGPPQEPPILFPVPAVATLTEPMSEPYDRILNRILLLVLD